MMDDGSYQEYGQPEDMCVIREIFDDAHELFENELESALEIGYPTIIIEPCRLGEETARWIFFGEYLTRYSIITGLGSIASGMVWPDRIFLQCSLLGTALLAHGVHLISWQQDICSGYRVEQNPEQFLRRLAASRQHHQGDKISLVTSTTDVNFPLTEASTTCDNSSEESTESSQQQPRLRPIEGVSAGEITPISQTQIQPTSQQPKSSSQHHHHQIRPTTTNPYEMILSTSARKNKSPVVLCRRNPDNLKRSKWINAAVSLLAIAFSFLRLVRNSFLTPWEMPTTANKATPETFKSFMNQLNKWSFVKNITLI